MTLTIRFLALCAIMVLIQPCMVRALPSKTPITIVTGSKAGTYQHIGRDIAGLLKATRPVQVLPSLGSIDNIRQMVERKNDVALGIVQSDILGLMRRSTKATTQHVTERLFLIFPFFDEEVHVLTHKNIKGMRDLNGKRIVIGEEGSGNMLTAMNILGLSEVKAGELLHMNPAEGILAVMQGDADAMFFVGGKPVPFFSNLANLKDSGKTAQAELLEQVHLIPIDDPRVYEEYSPTRITNADYAFIKNPIVTAKVTAVLVAYHQNPQKVQTGSAACQALYDVGTKVYEQLAHLRMSGHPKWKEVNLFQDVQHWSKTPCIWEKGQFLPALHKKQGTGKKEYQEELTKDLLDVLNHNDKQR